MYPPFDPGMAGMPGAAFPPPGAESVYVHVPPPSIPGGYGDAAAWGRGPIKDGGYPMRYEAFDSKPFRHGDWNCAKCQAHNFASRVVCFRCGAEKVE
ncbi:Asparagine-rich protein [Auxenochlorella protothecoides]|nr:Asparagine-rich protein [Auxenochlorella protothecoides]KFM28227.1 Asparagine-rich protein [Auxenochlorella protothecoides]